MKGAQVFPTWISTVKTKLGDGVQDAADVSAAAEAIGVANEDGDRDQSFMKAPRIIYKGHQMPVRCLGSIVVPNSESSIIFSGGEDKLVFAWSLKTGEKVAEMRGHTQRVTSIATLNREGMDPYVITAGWDERVRIWPLKCLTAKEMTINNTAQLVEELSTTISSACVVCKGHTNRVFGLTVVNHPSQPPFVASGSSDNTIRVWSLPEGVPMYVLEDEEDVTWNLCLNSWYIREPVGNLQGIALIAGCKNSTVRVWSHRPSLPDAAPAPAPVPAHTSESNLNSSLKAVFGTPTGTAKPPPAAHTGPDLVIGGHPSAVHSLVPFDYQGQAHIATVCKDHDIRIFILTTGELMRVLRGHKNFISNLAAVDVSNARGGALLVSASREGANMRVWRYSTGECLRFFKGHTMDVNAVEVFTSPNTRSDDLIIISGSRDTTVRTWLYAEEKALKVLDHGHRVKIKAMDVFQAESNSLVVTGADDGGLRAWRTKRNEGEEEHAALEWKVEKAHPHQILAVAIYTPLMDLAGNAVAPLNPHWPAYLAQPLVLSASRSGLVRVSSLADGKEMVPAFKAHSAVVTSLCVCAGAARSITSKGLDPFLVTGSEDNTAVIWSMLDFSQLRVLEGHIFDVTAVCVYLPNPLNIEAGNRSSNPTSRSHTPRLQDTRGSDPIIATGSMDQAVRLWQYSSGECLAQLSNADSHITSVACMDILPGVGTKHVGPMVFAGDGYGVIWMWSLNAPYTMLRTLTGHTDEVRSVYVYDAEGLHPVLVSGSLDCTVKVWNLDSMKLLKTVEGHTGDVTEVRVFNLGGSDLALVSSSLDTTVRVVFDFMEAAPQYDVVMQLFQLDLRGTKAHFTSDSDSAFPRIAELSKREGASEFFGTYSRLFVEALLQGRADFLEEFLPLSVPGLLRSNRGDGGNGTLLRLALEKKERKAIRTIISCWCSFFGSAPEAYIHDEVEGRISMEDMLTLAEAVPVEFQKLICSIKLVPLKSDQPPRGAYFLYEKETVKSIFMSRIPLLTPIQAAKATSAKYDAEGATVDVSEQSISEMRYLYLPLTNAAHMEMLHAYTSTCEELDSVEIFNSDVGKLALAYAWHRMGLRAHLFKMAIYFVYIVCATASLLTFASNKSDPHTGWISYALIIVQLALDVYFMKEEWLQMTVNTVEYFLDIWNAMDFTVVITNVVANILRLSYNHDSVPVRVLLSISSIVGYFNILYYLRAFEETGPLVSMILKISQDMMYLIVVVMIVLVGFSQAFWILAQEAGGSPFGTIEASLLTSFVFMLGGYDPSAFEGLYLNRYAIALSCLYMLIVSILLLNLLIALMGDSYGSVKEKGLAQWKLEQAQIITEMQGSMSEQDRTCTATVYLRTHAAEPDAPEEDAISKLEATIADLKGNQKAMLKALAHVQERLNQQAEVNFALKEFLSK